MNALDELWRLAKGTDAVGEAQLEALLHRLQTRRTVGTDEEGA